MPTKKEVTEYLKNNPEFIEDYFLSNASSKLVESWVMQRSARLSVPCVNRVNKLSRSITDVVLRPLTASSATRLTKYLNGSSSTCLKDETTTEVANSQPPKRIKKKTVSELQALTEKDFLIELIRDIAYELDVDSLSHKILVNVALLTKCDRSSLFLCKGHKDRKYLISRLFDVTAESTVEEAVKPLDQAIIIPFGVGIAGHAAATGEVINIKNAYQDPRFNPKVDKETGYKTNSILCMPIKNQDSEVIGVAQIINKTDGGQFFSDSDIEVFSNYVTFCGIGLTNAQLFDASVQEYKRNQVLLNLARNIFEDTECLDTVVRRIMTQAQDLLRCQRCTIYIIDKVKTEESDDGEITFSSVFDLIHDSDETTAEVNKDYWQDMADKSTCKRMVYSGFAMLAAENGGILNIDCFGNEKLGELGNDGFKAECMLCCPIVNNQQDIIGVAQLLNKKGAHSFDENDETMFEGFAVFCGLGLHNTQMYEKAALMLARQKLNMEVLQFHASAGPVDTEELLTTPIPKMEEMQLHTFEFDDIEMTDLETCVASLRMFMESDLLHEFNVPLKTMCNFILTIKKNYRPVAYHNWRHAFNVAQSMFTLFQAGQMLSWFTDLEVFVLLIGCLCHDLDHRGTNNSFQAKSESPIALLYGTSTMEQHHFNHSVMILKSEGSNIFDSLNDKDYKLAMKMLEDAILSTDLTLHFNKRAAFQHLVDTKRTDWTRFENRGALRGMMMTVCDVAAVTKPWEIHQRVAERVAREFFEQGDKEKSEFSTDPIPMMDRNKHKQLPQMQIGFIDVVCMPLYKVFYHINPLLKPLYDGVVNNKKNWQNMVDSYEPLVIIQEPPKDRRESKKSTKSEQRGKGKRVSFCDDRTKSSICTVL